MSSIEDLYRKRLASPNMGVMVGHMERIRHWASKSRDCAEFGIRRATSTIALLAGTTGSVYSFDVERLPQFHDPVLAAAKGRWFPTYQPSHLAPPVNTDLLLIDSYHNYSHVKLELEQHGRSVRRYMLFHDTIACALNGEGITGNMPFPHYADKRGIRMAIDEWMIEHPEWCIAAHYEDHNGLLVLERR